MCKQVKMSKMRMYIKLTVMAFFLCSSMSEQTEQIYKEYDVREAMDTLGARIQQQDTIIGEQATLLEEQIKHLEQQETRLREQEAEMVTLKKETSEMKHGRTSSTYVRWGRTTCSGNGSELVYSGYVGGSYFLHTGAAVDYLCLPKDPSFAYYEDKLQQSAYVYGAEYELAYSERNEANFFPDNDPNETLLDKEVPCAVCKTTRLTVLMVPARQTCHDGWTREYNGYLSAGYYGHAAGSQYVCLDGKPEYLEGGGATNDDGVLFFFVESRCGSLRCPPYADGRELTCAVCSI